MSHRQRPAAWLLSLCFPPSLRHSTTPQTCLLTTMKRYLSVSTILSAALTITNNKSKPTATTTAWTVLPILHRHSSRHTAATLSRPFPSTLEGSVRFASFDNTEDTPTAATTSFQQADSIQIEIVSFGPLGATVHVVGMGHSPENLIEENDPPLGRGLVLQQEIHYFRQARDNVDVIRGEVLPAYVERVRDDGKLDISLRLPGGKSKAEALGKVILERLEWAPDGIVQVGDKSSPQEIGNEFPGVSKGAFKKAVAALYKKGLVQPGPDSISLMKNPSQE